MQWTCLQQMTTNVAVLDNISSLQMWQLHLENAELPDWRSPCHSSPSASFSLPFLGHFNVSSRVGGELKSEPTISFSFGLLLPLWSMISFASALSPGCSTIVGGGWHSMAPIKSTAFWDLLSADPSGPEIDGSHSCCWLHFSTIAAPCPCMANEGSSKSIFWCTSVSCCTSSMSHGGGLGVAIFKLHPRVWSVHKVNVAIPIR